MNYYYYYYYIYLLYKNNISLYNDKYIFSPNNFCLILVTFKKVNETTLNPRQVIPVCDDHGQKTSSVCYFVIR